ncbi:putative succinylglutamate desuccinylase [Hylemonella gracilis ATCC 19624]|uniref:Putative succinylglutamate desuccinylase n=2 Tax=Hylemonella gracilis TaxID=80880 RepID=F3KXA7_9BURK|nr:putative succinylglutamate desuccinylase [Hylemonella gracilis ATCC 19624]
MHMNRPTALRAHQFVGFAPGPRLIVLGAVHGNETCGTQAIHRVLDELTQGAWAIERGTLTLVPVTNPLAYRLGQRQGDRNLNRNLGVTPNPVDFEDHVANVLCPWLQAHDVLLDLHSFHTAGQPFVMIGPEDNAGPLEPFAHAREELQLVRHLGPTRVVEGWMETYARGVARRRAAGRGVAEGLLDARYGVGTSEYMRTQGGYGVTLECGQHEDPSAPEVAYQAIRQAVALLGLASLPLAPPSDTFEVLRLVDVIDRESPADRLARTWSSFDPVGAGEVIGLRADGSAVRAPTDGFVVFPNPAALVGNEWFYFAQRSQRQL